jgi:hypothetical protein
MKAGTCGVSIVFTAACKSRTVLELRGSTTPFQRVRKGFTLRRRSILYFRHRIVSRSHLADWWIVRYGVFIASVVVVCGHVVIVDVVVVVIVHGVVVVVRIVGILVRLRKNYCCYSKISLFFLPLTRTDPKTSLTRMIVTIDTTIGFDKLVHVLKAENMVYSFISIHENQHFRYFGNLVYGFYLTSLILIRFALSVF